MGYTLYPAPAKRSRRIGIIYNAEIDRLLGGQGSADRCGGSMLMSVGAH